MRDIVETNFASRTDNPKTYCLLPPKVGGGIMRKNKQDCPKTAICIDKTAERFRKENSNHL